MKKMMFLTAAVLGIADDPGCMMEYTKVDDSYYWSGDPEHNFNQLVSTKDVPELDTENSEHIVDYQYQYRLNLGYNSEASRRRAMRSSSTASVTESRIPAAAFRCRRIS